MIDELEWVKRERPDVDAPNVDAQLAAVQALESAIEAEHLRRRRRVARWPRVPMRWLAPVAGLLVVAAVVVVFIGVRDQSPVKPAGGGLELVFRAEPTAPNRLVDRASVERAVAILRQRLITLHPLGGRQLLVGAHGDEIHVHLGPGSGISRAQLLMLLDTMAPLTFYDWEANAIAPNGRTVAHQLLREAPGALQISQGVGAAAPGLPGAGGLPLYQAVLLASRQPTQAAPGNSRQGPEYFAFGMPDSAACATAASYYSITLDPHLPCYLSGPSATEEQAITTLPAGVSAGEARVSAVQRGTVVLEAVAASYAHPPAWSSPSSRFYVLRDHASLFADEIANPQQSTDVSGSPDVSFDFTSAGATVFHAVTAGLAHRGALVSGFGQTLDQHFAIAIDGELLSVPSIDYRTYPDGIQGANRADISGGFTVRSAQALASLIRLGPMPVALVLVAESSG